MKAFNLKMLFIWSGLIAFTIFAILIKVEAPLPDGVKKDNQIFGIIENCKFDLPDHTNRQKYGGREPPFVSMVFSSYQEIISGYFQEKNLVKIRGLCKSKANIEVSFTAKKLYIGTEVIYRIYQIKENNTVIDFIRK